jgi:hypothetical protein
MQIMVLTLTGETTMLYVKASDTIRSVKAKIQQIKRIVMRQQRLVFDQQALEDHYKLSDYQIHTGSMLTLAITDAMEIFIKPRNGARIPLTVYASDTINILKTKIEQLSGGSGLPPADQRLTHHGCYMSGIVEPDRTLSDWHIYHHSTVELDWDNSDDDWDNITIR